MKRILVIDDDAQFRQMLRQMLERQGYEVVVAQDGEEGIKLHHQAPVELIITDMIMPNKNGVDTILEFWHDFPNVKIIAISGVVRGIRAQKYLFYVKPFGISRVFSKPFDSKELLGAIQELLCDKAIS